MWSWLTEEYAITDQIDEETRVLVAVRIGAVQLIDNMNALEDLIFNLLI